MHNLVKYRVLLWVLFLFGGNLLYAQVKDDLSFSHLTNQEGLSQSIITSIAQDKQGFMWIGTEDGLNRYDGLKVKVYRRDFSDASTISDNWIRAILLDSDNDLWFCTHNGLSRYVPMYDNFVQYHHNPNNINSLSSNYLLSMCEYNGELWIGTGDQGISRYNKQTHTFTQYQFNPEKENGLPDNEIKVLYVDKSNTLWVGTNNGLAKYDPDTDVFKVYKKGRGGLTANEIRAIFEDSNRILWIGTGSEGLNYFNKTKTEIHNLQDLPRAPDVLRETGVNAVFEDDEGTVWFGSNQGLVKRKIGDLSFDIYQNSISNPSSLKNNDISYLFQDSSKMLWVGTKGGGVNIYDVHQKQFKSYVHDFRKPNSLAKDVVRAIYEDRNGIVWIGLREGGMDRYDPKTKQYINFKHEPQKEEGLWANTVSAIYEDSEGYLWVGAWGEGLNRMNKEGSAFTHFVNQPNNASSIADNRIQAIFEDRDKDLWVATDGGLNLFDRSSGKFFRYVHDSNDSKSLSDNAIQGQAICQDEEGFIWIGTYSGGLNKFDKSKGEFVHFKHDPKKTKTSLPNKGLISIYNQNDVLWIGTDGGGLVQFNIYTNNAKTFTIKDGLCSNVIYAIKPARNGFLWLSTKNGLSKFNTAKSTFKNYYDYHGLQSNVFYWGAAHRSKNTGELFFGGINGMNSFFPEKIIDNSFVPPVYITDFKINNMSVPITIDPETAEDPTPLSKHISLSKEINLHYTNRFFTFEFAALNYSHPERNIYKYKLKPFDKDWIYTDAKNPYAPYTNLSPGTYTFTVMGANNDGLWNYDATELKIIIAPPWWDTIYARIAGVLLVLGIAFGFYRARVVLLERQKRELVRLVQIRTAEITQKTKELEKQKGEIEKKTTKIESSIHYAQRIQKAMLPIDTEMRAALHDYFVIFKPRDVVSGDFYWTATQDNRTIIAVVDCTGHGVPGAFMSMIGIDLLKEIVLMRKITDAGHILNEMHRGVRKALHQEEYKTREGMDVALCVLETQDDGTVHLEFSGAHNPMLYIQDGEMHMLEANRMGIGGFARGIGNRIYEKKCLLIDKSTVIYLFSDGYQDQFGGAKKRKLMKRNFRKLLMSVHDKSMKEQQQYLDEYFEKWKQDTSQTDDVLVLGFSINP